jgi:hypothetical protein
MFGVLPVRPTAAKRLRCRKEIAGIITPLSIYGGGRKHAAHLTTKHTMTIQRVLYFVALTISVTLIIGCGGSNPQGRVPVAGEVTLDGVPLAEGNVELQSLPDISPLIVTGAVIKNGRFSMTAEFGLIPGQQYAVRFSALEEIPGTRDPMAPERWAVRDIIPPQYGSESKETITATVAKPNKLHFDLKSK